MLTRWAAIFRIAGQPLRTDKNLLDSCLNLLLVLLQHGETNWISLTNSSPRFLRSFFRPHNTNLCDYLSVWTPIQWFDCRQDWLQLLELPKTRDSLIITWQPMRTSCLHIHYSALQCTYEVKRLTNVSLKKHIIITIYLCQPVLQRTSIHQHQEPCKKNKATIEN